MDSLKDTWGILMWVSPFRNLRIIGYLLLPVAYRSLSRLSSALSAKASTLRPFLLNLRSAASEFISSAAWFSRCIPLHGDSWRFLLFSSAPLGNRWFDAFASFACYCHNKSLSNSLRITYLSIMTRLLDVLGWSIFLLINSFGIQFSRYWKD